MSPTRPAFAPEREASRPPPSAVLRGVEGKLNAPVLRRSVVHRPALEEGIVRADGQLVVIQAPAGFGKTTAMCQARARMEDLQVPTAWLTLDAADNDASRFLACLQEAVRRLDLEPPTALGDVIQALLRADAPWALFLDEFEAVQDAAVLAMVRELAHQLPRRAHLVIGTRQPPALGLARLRVRGQLVELDAERLRFTLEETHSFFGAQAPAVALDASHLNQLHGKTEGWVAALWLAAMALDRSRDPSEFVRRFSGSDQAMADYLAEEVLSRQPPRVQEFLLRTSILRQLDASVCAALNPREDGQAILEQLDTQQLFLTPVAGTQRAWKYHSLFADYLRNQLQRRYPDEVMRLHLAASAWYESQGRPVPAIDHAIEGGDLPHALALLETHAEAFLAQGRMRLLARWGSCLPCVRLDQFPKSAVSTAWGTLFTRGPEQTLQRLDRLEPKALLEQPYIRANVESQRMVVLAMQDRRDEALREGHKALARLPTASRFADVTLLTAVAQVTATGNQPNQALQLLNAARREHGIGSHFNRMYLETTEGLLDLRQGRLRQATARFRMAVDATHAVDFRHTHGNAWAGVFYAYVVYEANQVAEADHLLNVYLPMARDVGLPDHMILSHAMRSRIAFIHGDVDVAAQTLRELEYLGLERKLPRVVATARLEQARLLLLRGHARAARDELARANDAEVWAQERHYGLPANDIEYLALSRLRWEVAAGDAQAALAGLEAEVAHATALQLGRRLLTLRLLKAAALYRCGDVPAAMTQLAGALQVAGQEGYLRLVLDEGTMVGQLVQRLSAQHDAGPSPDPLLGDYLRRLLQAFGPLPLEPEPGAADLPHRLVEPLTRKEVRVLELLVEGYSNSAMAEKLYVSDSTVRTHLRNINTKLGANSRTQAVAIARKLGLVA